MGLNGETAKVVWQKVSALSEEQRKRMVAESAVAAQFQMPTAADLWTKIRSRPRKTGHKKLVVFDLDETLVHGSMESPYGDFIAHLPEGREAAVTVRPFAHECLREASRMFEVAVFTAGQEGYANQVLEVLDPRREFVQHRLYRDSCLDVGPFVFKDLRVFREFALKDILMVDNSVFGFAFQRANGIPVNTWVGDTGDEELRTLVPYLKLLASLSDVRPFNYSVFSPLYENH